VASLTPESTGRAAAAFARRAARAGSLAPAPADPAEPLVFAAGLYAAQAELAGALDSLELAGALELDLPRFRPRLAGILDHAERSGPPGLAADAPALRESAGERLLAWWRADRSGRSDYLCRALLRPYAEVLAARSLRPEPPASPRGGACPFCSAPASIGFRRAEAGDAGAQRFLACSLCGTDWAVNRIRCPACGEENPDKLPHFQSDRYPAVRLESCETCRTYLKSIDLTVDARAIPEVDDLASLSLDLWASDQSLIRLEPSLAGI
jgi:FdhE protein